MKKRKIALPDGSVKPFPKERFLKFVSALRVQTKDYGLVELELLGSQLYVLEEIIKGMEGGVTTFVILKARQLGISTFFLALDLFWAFEHPGLLGVFATHDEGSRDQFRNQIEVFLTTLPAKFKIPYETNNRLMLVLENASLFRYLVAGTRTTTNKLGRSGGSNFAHCTEVAFWGSPEDLNALQQTFSELYANRLYFFETTANGFNHFYDMWQTAKASPAQKAIFVGWWRDERNEFGPEHSLYLKYMPQGTATPLTPIERERVKEVKDLYGYPITAGQVAWYRSHLENKCNGDQSAMDQEMPWTEEDAFISTGGKFFSNQVLTGANKVAKKYKCLHYVFKLKEDFLETAIQPAYSPTSSQLKIWELPQAGTTYVVGADPIFGSSDESDNGVITVYRCFADQIVQVAEYATPGVSTLQFAWVLAYICGLYQHTLLALELTGPGQVVYMELKQLKQKLAAISPLADSDMRNCLKYMKDFYYSRVDSMSGNMLLQWKSSPELRRALLHLFHDCVSNGRQEIRSNACLDECRFLTIDEGYIGVPSGKFDDRIFASGLAAWAWDRKLRRKLTQSGSTREQSEIDKVKFPDSPVSGLVKKFLKDAKIHVGQ